MQQEFAALCRAVGETADAQALARSVAAQARPGQRLLELGCGCGASALALLALSPRVTVDALELQPRLAAIARRRAVAAGLGGRLRVVVGDVVHPPLRPPGVGYAHIFCNPPYFPLGAGRLPPLRARALARFEVAATLDHFLTCAADLLAPDGLLHLACHPARLAAAAARLAALGLADITPAAPPAMGGRLLTARRPGAMDS